MSDVRFQITADGGAATREVERVKQSLNSLPAATRTAQGGLDGMGMSAAQTAAAMRQVPMQVTDIVTSLASGQPAFMVAIQQGGQLKDSFGGIVPAAKALSSTLIGMVNPLTLAAAAAVAVGVAFVQNERQASAYAKSLILSGNAIGLTTDQLTDMGNALASSVGSQGVAAAALATMAGSSKIAAGDLQRFTAVAVEWERVTGQAVDETRKQFESLAEKPLDALIELNKGTNFLTVSIFDQVRALKEQGREAEAAEVAQRAYAASLERRAADVQESTNKMVRAWAQVKREAASAWAAMVRQFDDKTVSEQLRDLDQQIATLEGRNRNRPNRTGGLLGQFLGDDPRQLEGLRAQRDALAESIRLSQRAADAENERSSAERRAVDERIEAWRKEEEAAKKREREAEAASKARIRTLEQEQAARQKLDEIIAQAEVRDDERLQAENLAASEQSIKLWFDEAAARTKAYEATDKQVTSFAALLANIQHEGALLRMTAEEREFANAMRELENLGVERGTAAWEAYADALRKAIGERGAIRDGVEAAKEFEAEWSRTADQIGQSLSDALMDGGKSAAEYLKGLFRNLVLRPLLQPITTGITGGWAGAASASGGGGSSLSSLASMAGSIGSLGSFAATGFMNTLAGTGMVSGLSAAGSLVSGGSIAGGIGMGLGAVAPYALAAYALYSLLSSGGEKRGGSSYGYSASGGDVSMLNGLRSLAAGQVTALDGPSGGPIGGAQGDAQARAAVGLTVTGINEMLERLGSSERIDAFWGKLEDSQKGRGGVLSGGRLSSGASFGESGFGSNYNGTLFEGGTPTSLSGEEAVQAFALDLQQATIQALQAAQDIPASVKSLLRDLDAEALSIEQTTAILTTIEAMQGFAEAARAMGLSADLVTPALVEAAGGLEGLRNAAQETMQSVGGMLDLIDSAVRDLYGASSAVGSAGGYQSLMSGAAFGRPEDFSSALASARGYLGDTTQFGSALDQERARMQLAGYLDQYGRTTLQPLYDAALGIYGGPDPRTATATSGGLNALFSGDGSGTSKLEAEISALRDEQRAQASATVSALTGIRKIFERWDGDGMPDVRTV